MTEPGQDKLAAALAAYASYRRDAPVDAAEFLARHDDLREYLEPMIAGSDEPEPAKLLGDYELLEVVGQGGMGVVWRARQRSLDKRVAVKLLSPHLTESPAAIARFRREAMLAAALDHPGIASVYAFGHVDGQYHLAMELVDGRPLDAVLDGLAGREPSELRAEDLGTTRSGSYTSAIVELGIRIAGALGHAHERGVIHRDVKPSNIMLAGDGEPVLTDFGLARDLSVAGFTQTGAFAGTYAYASPEQILGGPHDLDARSDVYSVGLVLFELLTLQRPFPAETVGELATLMQARDPIDPATVNTQLERDLAAVVLRALAFERAERYADGNALAADLTRFAQGRPVVARPVTRAVRLRRWIGRNRLASGFLAVLAVTTAAISVLAILATGNAEAARHNLDKYERLRVGARVDGWQRRAEVAHPAWPENAGELAELIRIAGTDLAAKATSHERLLERLRAGAERRDERPRERGEHPASPRIVELDGRIARLRLENRDPNLPSRVRRETRREIAALSNRREQLAREVASSDRVWLRDPSERFLHDRMERQLHRLRNIAAHALPDLRFRLDWARRVASETVEAHSSAWEGAVERIRSGDKYAGLVMQPQLGLVPLGQDPESGLEEFAHALSGRELPARDEAGRLGLDERHGIVFVLIPGAVLQLPGAEGDVELDPFFLAKLEISRAQWRRLARGLSGLRLRDGGVFDLRNATEPLKPANAMSWYMCIRLLRRYGLTLPTQAQWLHAFLANGRPPARASARFRHAQLGRDPVPRLARIHNRVANPFGLQRLLGNVREWCKDVSFPSATLRPGDGTPDCPTWSGAARAVCGLGFTSSPSSKRLRDRYAPGMVAKTIGCRPSRAVLRH